MTNPLYIVQQHSENDNGRDRVDIFRDKAKAVARYERLLEEYGKAYGEDNADEKWELYDEDGTTCAKTAWTLPDGTTFEVYLSDQSPSDSDCPDNR